MRVPALLCLSLLSATFLPAQNLVQNPGFESYSTCPPTIGFTSYINNWSNPNNGTPDYHNACHTGPIVSVPTNTWGTQADHSTGQAYASIISYSTPSGSREYMQGQFSSPLMAGRTYRVSFWVSLTDKSKWAIGALGAYLSVGPVSVASSGPLTGLTPQIQNPATSYITDKIGWTEIAGDYTAAGGETHIVIGNFLADASTPNQDVGGLATHHAHYYLDDVSVIDLDGDDCENALIGWADLPSPSTISFIDQQDIHDNCPPARTVCTTRSPVRANLPWAGATAYDPRYGTVWVSDGTQLAEFYANAARECGRRCPAMRPVLANPRATVSGLALSVQRPRLFQLATTPGYMEITTYDLSGRCPGRTTTCRRTLDPNTVAAGLAYDEATDTILVTLSTRTTTGYTTVMWTAPAGSPCAFRCQAKVFDCSRNLVTGLAFDSCKRMVYATDGAVTQISEVDTLSQCLTRLISCCKKQTSPTWRGLAVRPTAEKKRFGRSCLGRSCPSCPNMTASCVGDPTIGSSFGVTLNGAPVGGTAYLLVKPGECNAGLPMPAPFCGFLHAFPVGAVLPPIPITGRPPCGGMARQNIPLPADLDLCGTKMCVQWFVVCPSPGFGLGLSNAYEFTISGS